jgi:hypothetical protein
MTFYQAFLQKDFYLNLSMVVVNDNKTLCMMSDATTDATITNIDGHCPVRNACLPNAKLQYEPHKTTGLFRIKMMMLIFTTLLLNEDGVYSIVVAIKNHEQPPFFREWRSQVVFHSKVHTIHYNILSPREFE